jgi:hypothetical protein
MLCSLYQVLEYLFNRLELGPYPEMACIDRLMREMPLFKTEQVPAVEFMSGQGGQDPDEGKRNGDLKIHLFFKKAADRF